MGVKNLSKIIEKFCPHIIKKTKIEEYKGKYLGIDASIYFYKFLYVSNKYNKPNYYLHLFFQQIINMIKNQITPIYIFDGKAPDAKLDEQEKRKETRNNRKEKLEKEKEYIEQMRKTIKNVSKNDSSYNDLLYEINSRETKLKSQEDTIIHVTEKHKNNLKALLTILSIPYVQGYAETDPLSTQLCKDKLLDGILSEDMDYMPLGCPTLIRTDRTPNTNDFEKVLLEYKYNDVLQNLGLNTNQFIDLCILCGCDYVEQLHKIGPMTAIKLIKDFHTIETILMNIDNIKHQVSGNYMDLVNNARKCFKKTHTHRITKNMLKIKKPNIPKLQKFMNDFCNYPIQSQRFYIDLLQKSPIIT